ncbi:unnamed protein product [Cyprideis torosa]|uniref:Alcohol dehydrogenase-like C-terminal domain-containing protein n=1 Tax=Cyprideis torosa TaxID=163714 RepID=A0A7R8WT95_9CRUS|nr:unnamed protein product [Cyprideis torosa]CAG0909530.1 unnamed protein product [Cyprideis torosa]
MCLLQCTARGGTIVLVGIGRKDLAVPLTVAAAREIDIKGVFRYSNTYPTALAMVSSGQINVKPLITNRFKLDDSVEAFNVARYPGKGVMKIMINCFEECE